MTARRRAAMRGSRSCVSRHAPPLPRSPSARPVKTTSAGPSRTAGDLLQEVGYVEAVVFVAQIELVVGAERILGFGQSEATGGPGRRFVLPGLAFLPAIEACGDD